VTYMQEVAVPGPAGEEPMSDRQAYTLWRLCNEAGDLRDFDPSLTRQRAAGRIEALIDEIRMRLLPPHTD